MAGVQGDPFTKGRHLLRIVGLVFAWTLANAIGGALVGFLFSFIWLLAIVPMGVVLGGAQECALVLSGVPRTSTPLACGWTARTAIAGLVGWLLALVLMMPLLTPYEELSVLPVRPSALTWAALLGLPGGCLVGWAQYPLLQDERVSRSAWLVATTVGGFVLALGCGVWFRYLFEVWTEKPLLYVAAGAVAGAGYAVITAVPLSALALRQPSQGPAPRIVPYTCLLAAIVVVGLVPLAERATTDRERTDSIGLARAAGRRLFPGMPAQDGITTLRDARGAWLHLSCPPRFAPGPRVHVFFYGSHDEQKAGVVVLDLRDAAGQEVVEGTSGERGYPRDRFPRCERFPLERP